MVVQGVEFCPCDPVVDDAVLAHESLARHEVEVALAQLEGIRCILSGQQEMRQFEDEIMKMKFMEFESLTSLFMFRSLTSEMGDPKSSDSLILMSHFIDSMKTQ